MKPHHSLKLLNAYGGEKELRMIEGDHNSARPKSFLEVAIKFMTDAVNGNISSASPEKKRARKQGNSTSSSSTTTERPKIPQSSSNNTRKKGDIFNVKKMQNNLFQSHKERQYIEGMSINTVLKQKEEEDNEDEEDFDHFQTPDPSPRKSSAKMASERRRKSESADGDVKPPSIPSSDLS